MMNAIRTNEILKEIRKIEVDREEAELYYKELLFEEKDAYEDLCGFLRELRNDYEFCYGDMQLTNLTEEYHNMLLSAERECSDAIDDIHVERRRVDAKCESDIEELRQEIKRLEMM